MKENAKKNVSCDQDLCKLHHRSLQKHKFYKESWHDSTLISLLIYLVNKEKLCKITKNFEQFLESCTARFMSQNRLSRKFLNLFKIVYQRGSCPARSCIAGSYCTNLVLSVPTKYIRIFIKDVHVPDWNMPFRRL